jgi:hypothetical protein
MVMKSKRSVLLASGAVTLIVGGVILAGWHEMRKHVILACVASIHQGISNSNLSESDLADVKSEWTVLSKSDGAKLIVAASKTHPFDCSRVKSGEPYLDYWGRPLRIGARKLPNGKLEYQVWSTGNDGEAGTSDDLVSPYGKRALGVE